MSSHSRVVLPALVGALALSCGARTTLETTSSNVTGGGGGTTPATCGGSTATLANSITLDTASSSHEPESSPRLVWKGPELFILRPQWTEGQYDFAVGEASISGTVLTVGTTWTISDAPDALDLRAAWGGDALAIAFTNMDNAIALERHLVGGALVGNRVTLHESTPVYPSALFADEGGYALVTASQNSDGSTFGVRLERLALDLQARSAGAELYTAPSVTDIGTRFVRGNGQLYGLWSMTAESTTTVLSLLDEGDAVRAAVVIDSGQDHTESGLAFDGVSPLVATYDYQQQIGAIWTVPPDGSSPPRKRADITGASAAPSIATDACGRLAVLAPTGMFSSDNPISNGLTFQLLDAAGNQTSSIALPVKHDYIEEWDMVAVDGGFAITWIEGNQSGAPSRELELAYVTVR